MCMVLYAAADAPLPEIAEGDPQPPLSVRAIQASEEPVRAHFTKPHVYFLGSHTGCSCGFKYGLGGDEDEQGRESVRELGAYLASAVERAGTLELYACWDGDEAEPETERASVTPTDFNGEAEDFGLPERWFATVSAGAS
jgi:hypothetical protein